MVIVAIVFTFLSIVLLTADVSMFEKFTRVTRASPPSAKEFKRVFTIYEVGQVKERGYVALLVSIVASIVLKRKVDVFSNSLKTTNGFVSKYITIVPYSERDLFMPSHFGVNQTEWCEKASGEEANSTDPYLRLCALTSFTDMMRLVLCANDCFYFDADAMVLRPPVAGVSMLPLTSIIDADEKIEWPHLMEDPHLNNNFFAFQNSPYYEQVIQGLTQSYLPRRWGSVGTELLERTWTMMNCSSAEMALQCPLIYPSPFTLYPGIVRNLKFWKKYMDMTQAVIHHYSVNKDLSYMMEYLEALLDAETFQQSMSAFKEESKHFSFLNANEFDPVEFACQRYWNKK